MESNIIASIISTVGGIIAAVISVKLARRRKKSVRERLSEEIVAPSKFWDILQNSVAIVFGLPNPSGDERWSYVSERDRTAAKELEFFLKGRGLVAESFSIKESEWQARVRDGADLIVIGGFVSNQEFNRHAPKLDNYTLKKGRLCRIGGQMVFHVTFKRTPTDFPDRDNPEAPEKIDSLNSQFVSKDFAYIFNTYRQACGKYRRIIGIAGIKGNGTKGAVEHLIEKLDAYPSLDSLLPIECLSNDDTLELVISTEADDNVIHRTKLEEIVLNNKVIHKSDSTEPCGLKRPCDGCDFGISS